MAPLAARGLPENSQAMDVHSCCETDSATGMEDMTRNWCFSAGARSVTFVSGVPRSSLMLPGMPPSAPFHARSPRERETDATAPFGLLTRVWPPSAWKTTPPFSVSHFCSSGRLHRPCFEPRGTNTGSPCSPPFCCSASQSTASHLPLTAVKSFSPTVSATTAPQPSWIAGCPLKISLSRSSKVFVSAAFTNVAFSYPGGRAERFRSSLGSTCFAHDSAAKGPGASAHDCPSKSANSRICARFSNRPPAGSVTFDRAATLRRSFTMTWRTKGFSPAESARPRLTASTATRKTSEASSCAACAACSSPSSSSLVNLGSAPCCFNFHSGVPE
mmetsp:Transcript_81485/g.230904  ORF Transcript_81485/g.230904 Transcript_81485/m.230904 type:complete len:330 (+) Transcript_81485:741-1730(+)